ncbi:MAG TPA: ATPase, T2SS/T4P/T4SS family [Candidatus Xenobia bacterium]
MPMPPAAPQFIRKAGSRKGGWQDVVDETQSPFLRALLSDDRVSRDELARLIKSNRTTPSELEPYFMEVVGKVAWLDALAAEYSVGPFDLEAADVPSGVAMVVPQDIGTAFLVACVDLNEDGIALAMVNPKDENAITQVEARTDFRVNQRYVVTLADIKAFQDMLYGTPRSLNVSPRDVVDRIIKMAIQCRATDIHIEPWEDDIQIRFRRDGMLVNSFDMKTVAPRRLVIRHLKTAIPVVVKNKSGASGKTMNIAENQKPQDGRIYLAGSKLDMRVSVLPTVHGESIVIRLHPAEDDGVSFQNLGFAEHELRRFRNIVAAPHGILLVSGPTGSGKTTTLYTVLRHLNKPEKKILTIEDPVERNIPGVMQVQTNAAKGVTFAEALRSFLRHDPDIIMVGEIRDHETAVMAVEASLTGHLVLSTVHANDAVRTITRIKDLGVNSLLLGSTCLGTLAQRLVRVVCQDCREPARFSPRFFRLMERYGIAYRKGDLAQGAGCPQCNHTGYRGRIGIFEVMLMTPEMQEAIIQNAADSDLESLARKQGMRLLIEDALTKAAQGLTTESEVLRVTLADVQTGLEGDEGEVAVSHNEPDSSMFGLSSWDRREAPWAGDRALGLARDHVGLLSGPNGR